MLLQNEQKIAFKRVLLKQKDILNVAKRHKSMIRLPITRKFNLNAVQKCDAKSCMILMASF